jgi:peptidoglycan/LPS O-acetylase OafA/YrhL
MSSLVIQPRQAAGVTEQAPRYSRLIGGGAVDRFYRPELDVLRFFAFLSVFLYHGLPGFALTRHTGWMARLALYETQVKDTGAFGVCLFFLLSAYLITELLLREKKCTGTIRVRSFYLRRILRIWPLYFAFLCLGVLLSIFFRAYRLEARWILSFLLLGGNWYVAHGALSDNPIGPLWSISVEEQFYLCWPWIACLGGKRWIRIFSLVLLPTSFACIYRLSRAGAGAVRFNSFAQFQFFALGALLALVLRGRVPNLRPALRIVFLLIGASFWLVANFVFHVDHAGTIPSPGSMLTGYELVAIGCLLFLVSFLGASPKWFPKPLVYLGKISYGLYVFHMLSLNILAALLWPSESQRATLQTSGGMLFLTALALLILVLAMIGTVILSALSYRFLERPFLRLKERFTFIRTRSV